MDHTGEAAEAVATISARVKELRSRKGWTGAELGKQLTRLGVRWDRSIVANFENGRRATVSVNELLALARVFDVAPIHLLVPPDDRPYQVAEGEVFPASRVRAWVRGEQPLPGTDERIFRTEVPLSEWNERLQPWQEALERGRQAGLDVRELPEHRRPGHLGGKTEGDDDE